MTKVRQQSPVLVQHTPVARVTYIAHDFRPPLHVCYEPINDNYDRQWDYIGPQQRWRNAAVKHISNVSLIIAVMVATGVWLHG